MKQYVLYHSSLTNEPAALEKLRAHTEDGEVVGEFIEEPSPHEKRPLLNEAVARCQETGAMLVVLDMGVVGGDDKPLKERGVKLKVLI